MCSRAGGYTRSSYQQTAAAGRDAQRDEVLVQAVVVVEQLGQHSMALTIPPALGLSSSIWRLQHTWADSPAGLLVNSTQSVGALQPGPRPLWFARLRNALVRGLFGRGHNPVWLLERWVQHCIEEVGGACGWQGPWLEGACAVQRSLAVCGTPCACACCW